MKKLVISAGPAAYEQIQRDGLRASDVKAVFGASGSAKWLTIAGLDNAIFSNWLNRTSHGIHLYGTSVGAWKLAAAAQLDSQRAFAQLAEGYIAQTYHSSITRANISRESNKLLQRFLPADAIAQILESPRYHFHCGTVNCHGFLRSEKKSLLMLGMLQATMINVVGRRAMRRVFDRVVFTDSRNPAPVDASVDFPTRLIPLAVDNFMTAITASGSIPYVMAGIEYRHDDHMLMLRDGGLADYHPVPDQFWRSDGLILYPHFYNYCTAGWFDKFYSSRRATPQQLTNVVMIAPSAEFVATLPYQRIPDRQDFKRFLGRDGERQRLWRIVLNKSYELGEAFMQLIDSDNLHTHIVPMREKSNHAD